MTSKARGLADLGNVYNDGALSNRNLIINGAMQVAQRGTSFSSFATSTYHLDRFESYNNAAGTGVATVSQSSDAPNGFGNSYKIEVTTANSSLAATAEYGLYHYMEGQNLQNLKKGTAAAESLTVSFWVKSSITGTFIVELMDNDNSNRHINKSYTIDSANTWEYKTITFEGDLTGVLDNDNNNSFHINWWLGAGSGFSSGSLQTSWGALSQVNRAVGQTNLYATIGNTWQLTGVQLEVGDTATPFEHRSYGQELALCQRYYQRLEGIHRIGSAPTDLGIFMGHVWGASVMYWVHQLAIPMRTGPSLHQSAGGGSLGTWYSGGSTANPANDIQLQSSNEMRIEVQQSLSSVLGQGNGAWFRLNPNEWVGFDAEL